MDPGDYVEMLGGNGSFEVVPTCRPLGLRTEYLRRQIGSEYPEKNRDSVRATVGWSNSSSVFDARINDTAELQDHYNVANNDSIDTAKFCRTDKIIVPQTLQISVPSVRCSHEFSTSHERRMVELDATVTVWGSPIIHPGAWVTESELNQYPRTRSSRPASLRLRHPEQFPDFGKCVHETRPIVVEDCSALDSDFEIGSTGVSSQVSQRRLLGEDEYLATRRRAFRNAKADVAALRKANQPVPQHMLQAKTDLHAAYFQALDSREAVLAREISNMKTSRTDKSSVWEANVREVRKKLEGVRQMRKHEALRKKVALLEWVVGGDP